MNGRLRESPVIRAEEDSRKDHIDQHLRIEMTRALLSCGWMALSNFIELKHNFGGRKFQKTLRVRIRLYNLPHEYWNEETFAQIGNKLRTFIKEDEAITNNDYNMYARICIYWQHMHPLPKMVELRTGEGIWKQTIEVEENIELCKLCKSFGHPRSKCSSQSKGKGLAKEGLNEALLSKERVFLMEDANFLDSMVCRRDQMLLPEREEIFDLQFLWSKNCNEERDQQSEEVLGNNLDGPWNQNEALVIENLLVSNATQ
ncbi:hypothetical protein SUGI_1202180 [Cryptomeria japonica]|nr:hypothetical protein SUGI_1202180 [Cryptomeria japonica]